MTGFEIAKNPSHFIDTNILFDIIYEGRLRHKKAMEFYKQFKNLELSVEPKVHAEANSVILKYIQNFAQDLNNFLFTKNRHSKPWDSLKPLERKKRLNEFLVEITKQKKDLAPDFLPFYEGMIQAVQVEMMDNDFEELKEGLLTMPVSHLQLFKINVRNRFTYYSPAFDINRQDMLDFLSKLKDKLKNVYFTKEQRSDMEIIISVIHLVLFGNASGTAMKFIILYTNDKNMISNYGHICSTPPDLDQTDFNEMLKRGITSVNLDNPYKGPAPTV